MSGDARKFGGIGQKINPYDQKKQVPIPFCLHQTFICKAKKCTVSKNDMIHNQLYLCAQLRMVGRMVFYQIGSHQAFDAAVVSGYGPDL